MIEVQNFTGAAQPFQLGTNYVLFPPGVTVFKGSVTVDGVTGSHGVLFFSEVAPTFIPSTTPVAIFWQGAGVGVAFMFVALGVSMVRKIVTQSPSFND
jgi:hypothetical protein